jgi:hypothetical protein
MNTAQGLADDYISNHSTNAQPIFVEPPPNCTTSDFRIVVDVTVAGAIKFARHHLEILSDMADSALQVAPDRYMHGFSEALCKALEKASGLYSSLTLRIHLGHYLLQNYKPGKFTFSDFEVMVRNPRATGHLDTR